MTTPHAIHPAILARYFCGTAAPDEHAMVEAWIGDDPARRAAIAAWSAAWRADAEQLGAAYDAETAWIRLSTRVGLPALVRDEYPAREIRFTLLTRAAPQHRRHARLGRWASAAAVVLCAGAGIWRALRPSAAVRVAVAPAVHEYTTRRAQRSAIRLPDGTEVLLNVASRLIVPATFGATGHDRELRLEGQAHFTVAHDSRRRFVVHTAHGYARDVGTRFDVRAYPDDRETQVVVAEGEVAVSSNLTPLEIPLRAGQAARVAESGRVTLELRVDPIQAAAWTRGRLELDDVTLAEATRRLGRWYDLDVHVIGDELAQQRVVGSYRDEPVTQVLDVIAAAVGARYEWRGKSIVFVPR